MFNLPYNRKLVRLVVLAVSIPVVLIMGIILMLVLQPRLPQAAMILYLELNSQARKIDAENYVAPVMQQAHDNWEKSRQMIQTQNKRFPPFAAMKLRKN